MAGHKPSWVIDSSRIATKIRSASGLCDPRKVDWKSNPTKSCPNCQYNIDNSDVADVWPGLPRGVKFDPSDQEIIWHLLAKVSVGNSKPHPFLEEFVPTVEEDDGICYTHPRNLPGMKQDGSVSHFFHRAIKAYNTGTRKRRKILGDDLGDVRWHKTGRTKPVLLDGVQKGCKKIMVLYVSPVRGGKTEKTNWVMHQYHLGTREDENEGEYVISKIFYQQQQQVKQTEHEDVPHVSDVVMMIDKVDPVTPKLVTPEPPRTERRSLNIEPTLPVVQHENLVQMQFEAAEIPSEQIHDSIEKDVENNNNNNNNDDDDETSEDNDKWWENESQFILSSQQLVEGLSICDEFLQSQSPTREGEEGLSVASAVNKSRLSDYARLGPEDLKRDLEECQKLVPPGPAPSDIELDTPPDFRLSQLEFESQDSYVAWGGTASGCKLID